MGTSPVGGRGPERAGSEGGPRSGGTPFALTPPHTPESAAAFVTAERVEANRAEEQFERAPSVRAVDIQAVTAHRAPRHLRAERIVSEGSRQRRGRDAAAARSAARLGIAS